jgi:hypothetical protein
MPHTELTKTNIDIDEKNISYNFFSSHSTIIDEYKLNLVASHNSELSNFVEQPLDRDVLLFSGGNSSGKSSKLNFYKYILTPEINFNDIKNKINTDKNKVESFKYYFPEDNSFWISEHEHPDEGVFCQIIVKNEAREYEVKRLFVQLDYDTIKSWLFNKNYSSTGITKKELIEKVKENKGIEISNKAKLTKIMFGDDETHGEKYNIVKIKNTDYLKDYSYFFDVFAGGIGDKDLVRKLFIKKVNNALLRNNKKRNDKHEELIDYADVLQKLKEFSDEISLFNKKKKHKEDYNKFLNIIEERKPLYEVFKRAPFELKKLQTSLTGTSKLKETTEEIYTKVTELISQLNSELTALNEQEKALRDSANSKVTQYNKDRKNNIKVMEDSSNVTLKSIFDTSTINTFNIKERSENKESTYEKENLNTLTQLSSEVKNNIESIRKKCDSEEEILQNNEKNELENNDVANKILLKIEQAKSLLSKNIETLTKTMNNEKDSFNLKKESLTENISNLKNDKIKNESKINEDYLINNSEIEKEYIEKISKENTIIDQLEKFNKEFLIINNNVINDLKIYNEFFNKNIELTNKQSFLVTLDNELHSRNQIISGEIPKIDKTELNKSKEIEQSLKVNIDLLNNELKEILNPNTLSTEDQFLYSKVLMTLKQSYTKQEYLYNKDLFVLLMKNFEVNESSEIFFANKSYGVIPEVITYRLTDVVKKELDKLLFEEINIKEKISLLNKYLEQEEERIKKIKNNKELAKKEKNIIENLITTLTAWEEKYKIKYNENITALADKIFLKKSIEDNKTEKLKNLKEHNIKDISLLEEIFKTSNNNLEEKLKQLKEDQNINKNKFNNDVKKEEESFKKEEEVYNGDIKYITEKIGKKYKEFINKLQRICKEKLNDIDVNYKLKVAEINEQHALTIKTLKKILNLDLSTENKNYDMKILNEKNNTIKKINAENNRSKLEIENFKSLTKKEIEQFEKNINNKNKNIIQEGKNQLTQKSNIQIYKNRIKKELIIEKEIKEEIEPERLSLLVNDSKIENFVFEDIVVDENYKNEIKKARRAEDAYNKDIINIAKKINNAELIEENIVRNLEQTGQGFTKAINDLLKKLNDLYSIDLTVDEKNLIFSFKEEKERLMGYLSKVTENVQQISITERQINKNFKDIQISNISGFKLNVKNNASIEGFLQTIESLREEESDTLINEKSLNQLITTIDNGISKLLYKGEDSTANDGNIRLENLIDRVVPTITKIDGTTEESGSNGTNTMFNILFAIDSFKDLLENGCGFTMPIVVDEVAKLDADNLGVALELMKNVNFKLVCATPSLNIVSSKPITVTDINLSTCWTEETNRVCSPKRIKLKATFLMSNRKDPDLSDNMKRKLGLME